MSFCNQITKSCKRVDRILSISANQVYEKERIFPISMSFIVIYPWLVMYFVWKMDFTTTNILFLTFNLRIVRVKVSRISWDVNFLMRFVFGSHSLWILIIVGYKIWLTVVFFFCIPKSISNWRMFQRISH